MHHLQRLLIDNRTVSARRFEIKGATESEATIWLYDAIVSDEITAEWWGGVAPKPFIDALNSIQADTIHLRINCPGGDVFAARTMQQALKEHKAKIIVHIDGLAASAASFIAMAGDEIIMADGSFFMIHNSWTIAVGNAQDLMATAGLLDKIDASIAQTYHNRTELDLDLLRKLMAAETWIDAEEAVEMGFADSVATVSKSQARWNLAAYDHAPKITPSAEPEASPADNTELLNNQHAHRQRMVALRLRSA